MRRKRDLFISPPPRRPSRGSSRAAIGKLGQALLAGTRPAGCKRQRRAVTRLHEHSQTVRYGTRTRTRNAVGAETYGTELSSHFWNLQDESAEMARTLLLH